MATIPADARSRNTFITFTIPDWRVFGRKTVELWVGWQNGPQGFRSIRVAFDRDTTGQKWFPRMGWIFTGLDWSEKSPRFAAENPRRIVLLRASWRVRQGSTRNKLK